MPKSELRYYSSVTAQGTAYLTLHFWADSLLQIEKSYADAEAETSGSYAE